MDISPESPCEVVPVAIVMFPVIPLTPALAVVIFTIPLLDEALMPLAIATSPPVVLSLLVLKRPPPRIERSPPAPEFPSPTTTLIAPPAPM